MSVVSNTIESDNKGVSLENTGIEVRVINHDKTEVTYLYDGTVRGTWKKVNEYYGELVKDGTIRTCFVKMI